MTGRKLRVLEWAMASALALVFLAAGLLKVPDPLSFARTIGGYRLAPLSLLTLFAVILPWIEIAAGAALLVPRWRAAGALLIAALTAVFVVVSVVTIARGLSPYCGCFGAHSGRVGAILLLHEAAVLAVAVVILFLNRRSAAPPKEIPNG